MRMRMIVNLHSDDDAYEGDDVDDDDEEENDDNERDQVWWGQEPDVHCIIAHGQLTSWIKGRLSL